jgi:8-oxo-dGTP pyrophosphatase MutT (NUDIX family)
MNQESLAWKEESRKKVFDCRIFSIYDSCCVSPKNERRGFSVIDAADWAITVPVLAAVPAALPLVLPERFVMVRQWRHGSKEISLEFPGGVFEPGENPQEAAGRELLEETGYKAGKITKLGEFNPNPAIMSNRVHFFLAEDLVNTGRQNLDADEFVDVELMPCNEVFCGMGKPPFIHALMASALTLYLQCRKDSSY